MFYIVEEESQIQYLVNSQYGECYVEIIPTGYQEHPGISDPCLVYIRPLDYHKGVIVPVNHSEGINVSYSKVLEILESIKTVYALDKKFLLYYLKHKNIVDVSLLYSLNEYKIFELASDSRYVQALVHKHSQYLGLNKIIPITLHYDKCEKNFTKAEKVINRYRTFVKDPSWEFYNNAMTGVFYCIERNGLKVRRQEFLTAFTPTIPSRSIRRDQVFSCYNINNVTGRPSNSFNSINFLAIPKTEVRETIVPMNDLFMEIDYDGYHVRLLGELVDHSFTEESIHTQLGRYYFQKDTLTEEEYKQSKQKTFQYLYSSQIQEVSHIPFFKKVSEYAEEIWEVFTTKKEVRVPGSSKVFTHKVGDLTKQKLLNYFIQNFETTRNVKVLKELLRMLNTYKTKIVLNTYDAILFDICSEERDVLIPLIEEIATTQGKYPIKIKYGKSYFF
jgi:hypothetical protein